MSPSFTDPGPSNTNPAANGVIQSVTWTDVENIAYIDDKIVKTTPTSWDAGAASTKRLEYATNGWVEATIFETNTNRVIGLSKDNPNTHYSSIDYGLYMSTSNILVYEKGTRRYNAPHPYNIGDKVKVEREGSQIRYYHNDVLFYTSPTQTNAQLIADISFYEPGSSFRSITLSPSFTDPGPSNTDPSANGVVQTVTWTDVENIAYIDDKIVKTTPINWDAGAVSTKRLEYATNGWVEATIFETNTNRVIGLSKDNPNTHYSSIDYGLYTSVSNILVYEKGTRRYNAPHPYNIGDKVRVEREGSQIRYYHNDVLFYTSPTQTNAQLIADISFYEPGSSFRSITLSPSFTDPGPSNTDQNASGVIQALDWTDLSNVAFNVNRIIKTGALGWDNGGAASVNTIPADTDGQVQVKVFETNTNRVFGLSDTNQNTHYNTIDFGIYFTSSGQVQVYENGTNRYSTSHVYNQGDIFTVQRRGTTIEYLHNGSLFYSSPTASNSALIVDLAFYENGATFQDISMEASGTIPPGSSNGGGHWSKDSNTIYSLESIAIGQETPNADHLLTVNGDIVTKGVLVTLQGWADYVFGDEYNLQSLDELKAFIKKNKHLPGIPSETEVVKDGVQLEDMAVMQMQKIEELTLYLLQQDALIKSQREKLEVLEKQINALLKK